MIKNITSSVYFFILVMGTLSTVGISSVHASNITLPESGEVTVEFVSETAGYWNSFGMYLPYWVVIFPQVDYSVLPSGTTYNLGDFEAGTELGFYIKTPPGHTWYTDPSLNVDGYDHVIITQPSPNVWRLAFEDLYNLGDRDFGDVVVLVINFSSS